MLMYVFLLPPPPSLPICFPSSFSLFSLLIFFFLFSRCVIRKLKELTQSLLPSSGVSPFTLRVWGENLHEQKFSRKKFPCLHHTIKLCAVSHENTGFFQG